MFGSSSEGGYALGVSDEQKKKKRPGFKVHDQPEMTDTMLEMKAIPFFIDQSGTNQPKVEPSAQADDADFAEFDEQDDTIRIEADEDDVTMTDFLDDSEH